MGKGVGQYLILAFSCLNNSLAQGLSPSLHCLTYRLTAASTPIESILDNQLLRHRCLRFIQARIAIFESADFAWVLTFGNLSPTTS